MTAIKKNFSESDMTAFEPTEKVGIVACINPEGLPHVTLITTMQAGNPEQLLLGEFSKGLSKQYIQENRNIAFLIMTLDRRLWRGKAEWTSLSHSGPEYDMLNNKPMFRYNTYFGINTVHYLDLVEVTEPEPLAMGKIILAAIKTMISKGRASTRMRDIILPGFGQDIFNGLDSLKFISYIGDDGFPVIIPLIQCQAADSRRLAFSRGVYDEELIKIPVGATVAVFGMTMKMEDILVRGTFRGFRRYMGIELGTVDINWVYNSMPPAHGQIYPEVDLETVTVYE